jgi:hypothetical protein
MRARMRAPPFQRLMHRLALAATFALLLVPSIGRMAQAGQGEALRDTWGAMCTAAGLVYETTPTAQAHHQGHHDHGTPAMPGAPHHGSGDCDYCPLLQSMVVAKAPALVGIATLAPVAPAIVDSAAPPQFRHPTGLGSRGPPATS